MIFFHFRTISFCIALCVILNSNAELLSQLQRLKKDYPEHIQDVSEEYILWTDGTVMPVQENFSHASFDGAQDERNSDIDSPSLADQAEQPMYIPGIPADITNYTPPK